MRNEEERAKKIYNRLFEHYRELEKIEPNREIFALFLQGSQNYNLDINSETYQSDIDSKAIVLPNFEDLIERTEVSYTHLMENDEHIDIKDLVSMFKIFKKQNISYLELLYSDFIIINPKYKEFVNQLIEGRDLISKINPSMFFKSIVGMMCEKRKALTHPYPSIADKIEKYGYDPKQLHHIIRLEEMLERLALRGDNLESAFKAKNRDKLLSLKEGKLHSLSDTTITVEEAIKMADEALSNSKETIKNFLLVDLKDTKGDVYLKNLTFQILQKSIMEGE